MPQNPRVFIIQRPQPKAEDGWTPDLSPCLQYGAMEFVFEIGERAFADPAAARRKAEKKLEDFDPEKDFILWGNFGDPATMWLVIMILVARGFKKLKYLYWSRRKSLASKFSDSPPGFYMPIEIDVSQTR